MKRLFLIAFFVFSALLVGKGVVAQAGAPSGWEGAKIVQLTDDSTPDALVGLEIDDLDQLHLLYIGTGPPEAPEATLYYRTETKGPNWTHEEDIEVPSFILGQNTRKLIKLDPGTRTIHILYAPYPDFDTLYYSNSETPDWELSVVHSLDPQYHEEFCCLSAAFDAAGNVHLAWHVDYISESLHWYRVMFADNSTGDWNVQQVSPPVFMGYFQGSGDRMPLAVETEGATHLTYRSCDYMYHVQNEGLGGETWVTDSLPFPPDWNSGGPTSLAVSPDNSLHMCVSGGPWPYNSTSFILYYFRTGEAEGWSEPDTLAEDGVYELLFVDEFDRPHVVWNRLNGTLVSDDVIYANKNQGTWSTQQILDEEPLHPRSFRFVIDSQGIGHGAFSGFKYYPDWDSTEIYYLGPCDPSSVEDDAVEQRPVQFQLFQNYPNPFNRNTVVRYTVKVPGAIDVSLTIHNVRGELVRELARKMHSRGSYTVTWDGTNDSGTEVASGVYFCRLRARGETQATKLLLLK